MAAVRLLCSRLPGRPATLRYLHPSACKYGGLRFFTSDSPLTSREAARERTDRKMEVNGVQLHYERRGAGPHAILCMPGALGSAVTDFGPQLEYFGSEEQRSLFTCVSYDPRGYGLSRPPRRDFHTEPEIFLKTDALDAHALMKMLGFSSFSVLGWSDGGVSAIFLAALFPEAVKRVIVWGVSAYITKEDMALFEKTRNVQNWSPRMREPLEAMYGSDFPQMWSEWINAMEVVYNSSEDGSLCMPELSQVQCPTLVVHGMQDPLCPQFHAEYLRDHIKGSKLELFAKGKHNLHLRFAKEFNIMVTEFLNK